MSDQLADSLVAETGTIRDAMAAVDRGGARIALATAPDGHLVGLATDGDIRRALLNGARLEDPIAPVLVRTYSSVGPAEGRTEVLDLMHARGISAVPVVDDQGRPVGLHLLDAVVRPVTRPNRALVMAGGQGLRLRPMTDTTPKPMLRVAGRPILERIVLHLVGHGIRRISISVNYLGDVIETHFGDGSAFGAMIDYVREDRPLGTAGAVGLLDQPPPDALIVMNGDLVTQADLGALLDTHDRAGNAATVGVRRYLHTVPFGCVEREGDRIVGWEEKPTLERDISTGIYALSPALVARVPRDRSVSMPEVLAGALDRGERIGAFQVEEEWIDVGQRDELERARGGSW